MSEVVLERLRALAILEELKRQINQANAAIEQVGHPMLAGGYQASHELDEQTWTHVAMVTSVDQHGVWEFKSVMTGTPDGHGSYRTHHELELNPDKGTFDHLPEDIRRLMLTYMHNGASRMMQLAFDTAVTRHPQEKS